MWIRAPPIRDFFFENQETVVEINVSRKHLFTAVHL